MKNSLEQNKKLVRAFYEGGTADLGGIAGFFLPDFSVTAPDYLPWGGQKTGALVYLQEILPQVSRVIDFSRLTYDSITAEDDRVVVVINVGVMGRSSTIKISEHWVLKNERAVSIWVAYFEPKALIELISSLNK